MYLRMIYVSLHAFKPVVCLYLIIFIINLQSETLKSSFTRVEWRATWREMKILSPNLGLMQAFEWEKVSLEILYARESIFLCIREKGYLHWNLPDLLQLWILIDFFLLNDYLLGRLSLVALNCCRIDKLPVRCPMGNRESQEWLTLLSWSGNILQHLFLTYQKCMLADLLLWFCILFLHSEFLHL